MRAAARNTAPSSPGRGGIHRVWALLFSPLHGGGAIVFHAPGSTSRQPATAKDCKGHPGCDIRVARDRQPFSPKGLWERSREVRAGTGSRETANRSHPASVICGVCAYGERGGWRAYIVVGKPIRLEVAIDQRVTSQYRHWGLSRV